MKKAYYDTNLMQWYEIEEDYPPFKQELDRYDKIIHYRDTYIKSVKFEHVPIDVYTYTTEPIHPDRFYLVDENEDIYMFEEDLYYYLEHKFH